MLFRKQVDRLAQLIQRSATGGPLVHSSPLSARKQRRHIPAVESMEPRLLMAADPIQIGAVYVEEDLGSDLHGDLFYITFQGGAPNTELRQLTIDGDLNSDGFGLGDLFFDTLESGLGADHAFAFQVQELQTSHPNATVQATVADGSTKLVLDFTHFVAGDKLIFSIDVDEVQFFDPNETDLDVLNSNFDPITSGVEFQNSILDATFEAPHYESVSGDDRFLNRYDPWLDETNLPLPRDNADGKRDRTAGAGFEVQQIPKPVSLSGFVYVDRNEDLNLQAGEERLAGVQLELFELRLGSFVSTGHTTQTDSNGQYRFGLNLDLTPGIYQVRESQPSGYYSVGATVGRLNGSPVGQTVAGNPDVLTQIDLSLGDSHASDLNFAENSPNSISGHVCVVTEGFDCFDGSSTKEPLANVLIELKDASGNVVQTTRSATDGSYRFEGLRAGTYSITEHTPANLLDGDSKLGSAGGTRVNSNFLTQILVGGGTNATDYDFCEILPSEISGHTYYDANNNGIKDSGETPLSNVQVSLLDAQGNLVASTRTDKQGFYRFDNLPPGQYRLAEVTPSDYLPGQAAAGTIRGKVVGQTDATGDLIDLISISAGSVGINYDFGEILAASISGRVFLDANQNCIFEANETGLAGVTVELLDANGNVLRTTQTDSQGDYSFTDLLPALYSVREIQPPQYYHGGQKAGTGGGDDSKTDLISAIDLSLGGDVFEYDFCEVEPGSISGSIFEDLDFDCIQDLNEVSLAGVTVELLNEQGQVLATTVTNANGAYRFERLRPGNYSVREQQPEGYFHGGQVAPTSGGDDSVDDLISNLNLAPGQAIVDADFCEVPPAEITGYVFQDGEVIVNETGEVPDDLRAVRNGQRTPDDQPIAGVNVELRTLTGALIPASRALPGYYSGQSIQVQTDENGFFHFSGIRAGSYHIYQIQPDGYEDGIDTPGTTTGYAINRNETETVPNSIIQLIQLSNPGADPGNDAILSVSVNPAESSRENNFSEVLAAKQPDPPVPPNPPRPPEPPRELPPPPDVYAPIMPISAQAPLTYYPRALSIGVGRDMTPTWHLSIINGGFPRGIRAGDLVSEEIVEEEAEHLDVYAWSVRGMEDNSRLVSIDSTRTRPFEVVVFDIPGAIPLSGDFDGDSYDELVLFADGEWFIDFNGNGRWDENDIWLKLGTHGDQPVVGDWDGDGKDDVGIFGRRWKGDDRALAAEAGLPDPENHVRVKAKNMPPSVDEAPDDPRLMKRSAHDPGRADLIDHVFKFGGGDDIAISGDFNGDGISSVGTFRDGLWILDVDGDGRLVEEHDKQRVFGQAGDIPVVGDFDEDGIDEIAVVRGNRVLVDSNDNGEFDSTDQVFLLESADGTVIVGDFDGDGRDEPVLHQSASQKFAGTTPPKA